MSDFAYHQLDASYEGELCNAGLNGTTSHCYTQLNRKCIEHMLLSIMDNIEIELAYFQNKLKQGSLGERSRVGITEPAEIACRVLCTVYFSKASKMSHYSH